MDYCVIAAATNWAKMKNKVLTGAEMLAAKKPSVVVSSSGDFWGMQEVPDIDKLNVKS